MKKQAYLICAAAVLSFLAGYGAGRNGAEDHRSERRVLYYVDPMNPAHTSDRGGVAPCGMKFEPVYADETAGNTGDDSSHPSGTVRITSEKRQLIGVRLEEVKKTSVTHTIRTLGRVVVDDRLVYKLNAATEGWIGEVFDNSVGSLVKKDEVLASFYSPEFLSAEQAYIYALNSFDRFQGGNESPDQLALTKANIQQYKDSLYNLGMGTVQIEELGKTRNLTEKILIRAPHTGFIISRNLSAGQRFEKGTEWYRLAGLGRIWVIADTYSNEARLVKPGMPVRVKVPGEETSFEAKVADVLPQFDGASLAHKVRLELDNPKYQLRPDMFVDVEFAVEFPETLAIPAEALLDSGAEKTVFVDLGSGYLEPRRVAVGWRSAAWVEIVSGLMEGEHIVTSGNFFLDSESRLKLAADDRGKNVSAELQRSRDPVCGRLLADGPGETKRFTSRCLANTYFFCSAECKRKFDLLPDRYVKEGSESQPRSGGMEDNGRDAVGLASQNVPADRHSEKR